MSSTHPLTTVYLIRHGATEANERVPYILQGNAIDLPLNTNGKQQAADLGHFFRDRPVDTVVCSHMLRARETASAIASAHNLVVHPHDDLQNAMSASGKVSTGRRSVSGFRPIPTTSWPTPPHIR
jgi:phosphohistidine phosphatase SixA